MSASLVLVITHTLVYSISKKNGQPHVNVQAKIEFYATGLFPKFLNKTRKFLITNSIKWNQEFFYTIWFVSQVS